MDTQQLATSYESARSATNQYNISFDDFVDSLASLDDDQFWKWVDRLKEYLPSKKQDHLNGMLSPFFRFVLDYKEESATSFNEVLRFSKTYKEKVSSVRKVCEKTIQGCSSDTFYDLMDTFPLLGKEMYDKAMDGHMWGDYKDAGLYLGEWYVSKKLLRSCKKHLELTFDTAQLGG